MQTTDEFVARIGKEKIVMYYFQKIFLAASLSAAAIVPTLSHAENAGKEPCILRQQKIVSVAPYKVEGRYVYPGNGPYELRGAEIYLAAEPGLTGPWLQWTLEQHMAAMKEPVSMADCTLDADNVRVEVRPAGPGFWVRIIAPDEKAGAEVLRRAQLLLH